MKRNRAAWFLLAFLLAVVGAVCWAAMTTKDSHPQFHYHYGR